MSTLCDYLEYGAEESVNGGSAVLRLTSLYGKYYWFSLLLFLSIWRSPHIINYRSDCYSTSCICQQWVGWQTFLLSHSQSLQDLVSWDAGSRLWCCIFWPAMNVTGTFSFSPASYLLADVNFPHFRVWSQTSLSAFWAMVALSPHSPPPAFIGGVCRAIWRPGFARPLLSCHGSRVSRPLSTSRPPDIERQTLYTSNLLVSAQTILLFKTFSLTWDALTPPTDYSSFLHNLLRRQ